MIFHNLILLISDEDRDTNGNNISSHCKLVAENFFESIPSGADEYIFKNVILNWDVEKILKNCLRSMQTTETTIVSNKDKQGMVKQKLAISHGGRIRTEKEFHSLPFKCGFEITNMTRSQDPKNSLNIIEAVPSSE
jgi:CTP:phosphocholine cytidylyltransferase-like protein